MWCELGPEMPRKDAPLLNCAAEGHTFVAFKASEWHTMTLKTFERPFVICFLN